MNFGNIKKIVLVITSGAIAYGGLYPILPVKAQSITPTPNNDTNTIINTNGNRIDISGGTLSADQINLFHSFQKFGLDTNQIANFLSKPNIQNILGRVMGGDPSIINGLIQVSGGNSNLFLLNPAGFIFGANASLNVPADFVASTANSIGIGTNWFHALADNNYATLVGTPTSFNFNTSQPGSIVNFGNLAVGHGANLRLIGGTVVSTGQLSAPGGNITVATVPGENLLRISQSGNLLSLEIPTNAPASGNISVATLPKLLINVGLENTGGLSVNSNQQVQLTSTAIPVNSGDVVVTGITAGSATLSAAQNLTLPESQLTTTGDLNLLARDTVRVRDSVTNPFVAQAGGNLYIQGNQRIDILSLNHPQTPFVSGGNLSLVSDGNVSGDAHFYSGGQFLIRNLSGGPGNFLSYYDPIIKADGDVEFGNYTGAALKVEATGSIQGGNITINSPDTIANIPDSDPDFVALTSSRALILRAGLGSVNPVNFPSFQGDPPSTSFTPPVSSLTPTGSIQVNNVITSSADGTSGQITLEATGNISTGTLDSSSSVTGSGGAINLKTTNGSINIGNNIDSSGAAGGGSISFIGTVNLTGATTITTGDGAGNISFSTTVNGGSDLTLNAGTGTITFGGAVGGTTALGDLTANSTGTTTFTSSVNATSVTTDAAGTTAINGNINTSNAQTYNDAVTIANHPQLTGNGITFASSVNGNSNLTANAGAGNLSFAGAVGATTALGDLTANSTGTTTFTSSVNATSVTTDAAGTTAINGNITTSNAQTYNDAVTIANHPQLTGNGITFASSVNGNSNLTANAGAGNLSFAGAVGGTTALGDLTANSTGTTTFTSSVNATSVTTDAAGTTAINGNITTSNAQTYNDAVTIANHPQLTGNGITFASTVNGNSNLTANAGAGNLSFAGAVGGTTALGDLTANSTGTTTFTSSVNATSVTTNAGGTTAINGNITTSNAQTYNDAVTIANHPQLTGNGITFASSVNGNSNLTANTGAGNLSFAGAVGGTTALGDLTANSTGTTTFTSSVNATSVTTDAAGTTAINGNITTSNAQTYNDVVTIANHPQLTGNGITFASTVNGASLFTLNASTGDITFGGAVGNTTPLSSLIATAANTKVGSNITTTGNQTFNSPVQLTGNSTKEFQSQTGTITFKNTLKAGNNNLTLTASEIDFLGEKDSVSGDGGSLTLQPFTRSQDIVVSGGEGTETLDISTKDVAALGAGFKTLLIGADNGSGNIRLNATQLLNRSDLEVRSPNGTIVSNGLDVKGAVSLDATTTTLNVSIVAQGTIDIPKAIFLGTGANVTLDTTGAKDSTGSNITLGSTIDGAVNLTLNAGSTGNLTFGDVVGGTTALSSLTATALNTKIASNITTTGNQTFNSPLQLTGNATFSAGNNINFNNTIDGGKDLAVVTPANVTFGNVVGGKTKLNSLTTSAANITARDINTTGNITLRANNNITLRANNNDNPGKITTGTTGGDIKVTSQDGSINTGDLDSNTDRSGNAGNITLEALGSNAVKITTGTINTSSTNGNGGNVTVQAPNTTERNNAIQVQWINAEGTNLGGNVDIKTTGFFRSLGQFNANDKNRSLVSISTIGGRFGNGGTIKIDHGGDGFNPFYIGRSDINGTRGMITTGENFITPVEYFANSETRGMIQIITQGQVVPGKDELPPPQVVINNATSPVVSAIANIEDAETSLFEQKLNLGRVRRKSPQEIISDLQKIQKQTQTKTGLVYAEFSSESYTLKGGKANEELKDSDPLMLLLISPDGQFSRHPVPGVNRGNFQKIAEEFYREVSLKESLDSRPALQKLNTNSYKQSAQQLYKWLISPLEIQLKNKGINNLLLVMRDARLRSLPIAALMDEQEKFLIEKYGVTMIPTFSLINPKYVQSKNLEVLAMGAETFDPGPDNSNQITELLAAPIEAETIVNQVWQGQGKTLINQNFTLQRLATERNPSQPFGVIHLATHAVFTPGDALNSYIQLYDSKLTLNDVEKLGWNNPQVDLLVLSACQTAYGDEDSQLGLAGSAVKTGVRSVVASLWQVSDTGTLGLMTEFHRQLRNQPIKVEALRQAQLAMIRGTVGIDQDGKNLIIDSQGLSIPLEKIAVSSTEAKQLNLKHPFFWASFTLIGSPW